MYYFGRLIEHKINTSKLVQLFHLYSSEIVE